jgi:hypothetical protein
MWNKNAMRPNLIMMPEHLVLCFHNFIWEALDDTGIGGGGFEQDVFVICFIK